MISKITNSFSMNNLYASQYNTNVCIQQIKEKLRMISSDKTKLLLEFIILSQCAEYINKNASRFANKNNQLFLFTYNNEILFKILLENMIHVDSKFGEIMLNANFKTHKDITNQTFTIIQEYQPSKLLFIQFEKHGIMQIKICQLIKYISLINTQHIYLNEANIRDFSDQINNYCKKCFLELLQFDNSVNDTLINILDNSSNMILVIEQIEKLCQQKTKEAPIERKLSQSNKGNNKQDRLIDDLSLSNEDDVSEDAPETSTGEGNQEKKEGSKDEQSTGEGNQEKKEGSKDEQSAEEEAERKKGLQIPIYTPKKESETSSEQESETSTPETPKPITPPLPAPQTPTYTPEKKDETLKDETLKDETLKDETQKDGSQTPIKEDEISVSKKEEEEEKEVSIDQNKTPQGPINSGKIPSVTPGQPGGAPAPAPAPAPKIPAPKTNTENTKQVAFLCCLCLLSVVAVTAASENRKKDSNDNKKQQEEHDDISSGELVAAAS